jgi:hypothetical protein
MYIGNARTLARIPTGFDGEVVATTAAEEEGGDDFETPVDLGFELVELVDEEELVEASDGMSIVFYFFYERNLFGVLKRNVLNDDDG